MNGNDSMRLQKWMMAAAIYGFVFAGASSAWAQGAASGDVHTAGDFVDCPIKQNQAKNGSRPNPEVLTKLIRCKKGEKAVKAGDDGAVKVDVSAVQIGASRPWSYRQDTGNGQAGTVVYPVKATYTVRTLYRAATEVETGWVRVLNVYVNAFGEWQIGSEEPVSPGKAERISKK